MYLRLKLIGVNSSLLPALLVGCVFYLTFATPTAAENFVSGKDYRIVETEVARAVAEDESDSEADNTISVVEFFNYGCAHCYRLEPVIKEWLKTKAEDVEFDRIAVPLRNAWAPLARVYYVAVEQDVLDKIHDKMFKAIFEHNLNMSREVYLEKLLGNYGVEPEDFQESYRSDTVNKAMLDSGTKMRLFGLTGTPGIVVANKYVVDAGLAQGDERMFEIVDYLVDKVREEHQAKNQGSSDLGHSSTP